MYHLGKSWLMSPIFFFFEVFLRKFSKKMEHKNHMVLDCKVNSLFKVLEPFFFSVVNKKWNGLIRYDFCFVES